MKSNSYARTIRRNAKKRARARSGGGRKNIEKKGAEKRSEREREKGNVY